MALWLTALKVIPWGDVVAAAPTVARSARELWRGVRGEGESPGATAAAPAVGVRDDPLGPLLARVAALEERQANLEREATTAAELVASLAEQNQRLVEAVAILRARIRLLVLGSAALAVIAGALAWRVFA